MTAPHADPIIAGYLAHLESALAPAPSARRQELLDDIRAHIAEARDALSNETDADLLNILDRLGDPAEMAAAEIGREEPTPPKQRASRALEIAAIVLLLVFWPVGVILLWISGVWTTREKLIGTLVPPGGYLAFFVIGPLIAVGTFGAGCETISNDSGQIVSSTCPSGGAQAGIDIGVVLIVLIYLLGPILSAAFLAARMRRTPPGRGSMQRIDATAPMVGAPRRV